MSNRLGEFHGPVRVPIRKSRSRVYLHNKDGDGAGVFASNIVIEMQDGTSAIQLELSPADSNELADVERLCPENLARLDLLDAAVRADILKFLDSSHCTSSSLALMMTSAHGLIWHEVRLDRDDHSLSLVVVP